MPITIGYTRIISTILGLLLGSTVLAQAGDLYIVGLTAGGQTPPVTVWQSRVRAQQCYRERWNVIMRGGIARGACERGVLATLSHGSKVREILPVGECQVDDPSYPAMRRI